MIAFANEAWEDYLYWKSTNIKISQKIDNLIKDSFRSPFRGIGKPEPLKGEKYKNCWSRRIDNEHRFIYKFENETLFIVSCRYHYK